MAVNILFVTKKVKLSLCIILPQMSGYIKYFEYVSPNMSFFIKDDEVGEKYE